MQLGQPLLLLALAALAAADTALPTLDHILSEMERTDAERASGLRRYTCVRRYVLQNGRFNKHAEMVVRMVWTSPGGKEFATLSESGTALLRSKVLQKLMDGEKEAARELRGQTPITRANYEFKLIGTDQIRGRPCYLLELKSKRESKYLINGRAWVDAADFAVIRMDGVFSKNPSFWTKNVRIVHEFEKHGEQWLPIASKSNTDARIFGNSEVTISYYDYEVETVPTARASATELLR